MFPFPHRSAATWSFGLLPPLAGLNLLGDLVSRSVPCRPSGPAGDDADIVPQVARGQTDHLDQLAGEDGEIDPQHLPEEFLAADVVAEAIRADQEQARRRRVAEPHGPRFAGPQQRLALLAPGKVVHLAVFEQPRPAVPHAGANDAPRGPGGHDTRRLAGPDPVVRLTKDGAPPVRVALERGGGRHLSDDRFGRLRTGARAAGPVGDGDHHTAVQLDDPHTILASLLVSDGDGRGFKGEHGNTRLCRHPSQETYAPLSWPNWLLACAGRKPGRRPFRTAQTIIESLTAPHRASVTCDFFPCQ